MTSTPQLELGNLLDPSVVDPSIRVWPGDPDRPMPTLAEAYRDGHERGLTWPAAWEHVPGGPFAHGRLPPDHPCFRQAEHSNAVRKRWLEGWHDGFKQQHRGSSLPAWY